jgi:Arc/MetJ-type ribon-helix-helix transcriptional regulator
MTLHINLPEELQERLNRRAVESGYKDAQEYVQALVLADAEDEFLPEDVEQLLLDRLQNPGPRVEFNDSFKEEFRAEVLRRREHNGPKQ